MKGMIALFGIGFVGWLMSKRLKDVPRGIRNNNAGNIENNGIQWQGLSSTQTDNRFYQFETPEYGIRAIAKILQTYQAKYGINTVAGIINRWAPPFENNTNAYINHVAGVLGVLPDQQISVNDYMVPLVESIIIHENGSNPYSMETIAGGVSLA